MRIIWILFGLLIAIPLAALTWISSQVDADFLLDTTSGILEEEGISLTHTGEATFSLVPSVRLSLSQVTLIIPQSSSPEAPSLESSLPESYSPTNSPRENASSTMKDLKAQQISLEGFELTTNLFSFWRSGSAEISATRLMVDNIEILDFTSPIEIGESIVLPDMKARLWQGPVEAYAQINTQADPVTIETRGKITDADATSLLAAMANLGAAKGKLSAKWDLAATLPEAENDLTKLNGQVIVNGDQVTLTAMDLQGGMCSAISRAQGKRGPKWNKNGTRFDHLSMIQTYTGTEAQIEKLTLETNVASIEATANLDRATDSFAAKASAQLNNEALNLVPNCRINPRLANVAWPIDCRGKLSDGNPRRWCKVDVSEIVEQGLKGEIQRRLNLDDVDFDNPASLIQSLIKRK